jgi:hypothetical protein
VWSTPTVTSVISGGSGVLSAGTVTVDHTTGAVAAVFTGQHVGTVEVTASAAPACAGSTIRSCGSAVWEWAVLVNVGS